MSRSLNILFVLIILMGGYTGVRYLGSTIHYNSVQPAEDTPPPIRAVGDVAFYLTGGSLIPLWNHDATTVMKVRWSIGEAEHDNDSRPYEQRIAADVTTLDGKTKEYDLGTAMGCKGKELNEIEDHKIMLGTVECYAALTGVKFAAFNQNNRFHIERYDESARDGSIATTSLLEI